MATEHYTASQSGIRIDKFLSTAATGLSRSRIGSLCQLGLVCVNGKAVKSSYKLHMDDQIEVDIPADEPLDLEAENIPLDILYEDGDIIVINKPKGMIVHPAPGMHQGTLVNALLYHCKDLSGINGVMRPGIVHRIDKDTTGCLVVCKNDFAHTAIARQLENKTCRRQYQAIVEGVLTDDNGMIDAPIGRDPHDRQKMAVVENGKEARTHFHVCERFLSSTYITCELETGRTHQIRVHMRFIHHPVMGDEKYGRPCRYMPLEGQALHAGRLVLLHPRTGKEMTFEAPLPVYFEELLAVIRKESQ